MIAIVLAAGYATRLYPLTKDKPKALLQIGGKTLLDHIVDKLDEIGAVTQTVVVSNDKFFGHFSEWGEKRYGRAPGKPGAVILNDGTVSEDARRGAIGDIQFAVEELSLDDEVIIIAGDNFFTFPLSGLYGYYKKMDSDCVVVKKLADPNALKSVGVAVVAPDMRVIEFEEKPQNPKSDLAVYATYVYKRETLPMFAEYLSAGNPKDAPGNFPAWLCKRKSVYAYEFAGECYDVGTPKAYSDLCEIYGN